MKAFLQRSRTRQGCRLSTTIIQCNTESSSLPIRQDKEIKDIYIRKKEVKLLLLTDNRIPYIENYKDSTKKLLELIKKFSTAAGYKINIQKSISNWFCFSGDTDSYVL